MDAIELHGRLCRSDGGPADPGNYDLLFRLHPEPAGPSSLWEVAGEAIPVAAGGYFYAILGANNPLRVSFF